MEKSNERKALDEICKLIKEDVYVSKSEMAEILDENNLLDNVTYTCQCGNQDNYDHIPVVPTCSSCGESWYISLTNFSLIK